VQYDVAQFLQHGPKREVIQGFRGLGKSWLTSAFVDWSLLLDPTMNILVISASKDRADAFTNFTLRLIKEMPELLHLIPQSHQRQSAIGFDVALAPPAHATSVKSLGINSQITGSRADIIIFDDVEVPSNSMTQGMRDKLEKQVTEAEAVIKPDNPDARIIYLGTPQSEDTLYTKLKRKGYVTRVWPVLYPSLNDVDKIYNNEISPFITERVTKESIGHSTEPTRFTDLDLEERKLSYGRGGFALQFMLNPQLSDADRYPLKLNDLIITNVDTDVAPERIIYRSDPQNQWKELPNMGFNGDRFHRPDKTDGDLIPYTGSLLAIDPAGRGSDETGYAVVKMLNGYLHVPECGGLKGGYEQGTLQEIANIAKRNKVNAIQIEANFGDGMFVELLKPILNLTHPCAIEEVRHSKQKEKRVIDTLEPVIATHKLIIDPNVIEQDFKSIQAYPTEKRTSYSLVFQMSRITLDRGSLVHDDRLEALAIGVNYFTEHMAQDAEKRMESRRNKIRDKELRAFMKNAIGRKQRAKSWIKI
tara:strand:+ start:18505 stop:20097 length:1593 start_codon:yes stop_codon:yes gene_type:complete